MYFKGNIRKFFLPGQQSKWKMSVLLYFRSSIDMLKHVWIFSVVLSLVFLQPESRYLEKFHLLHRFSYTHSGIVSTYTSPASLVWELWRGSKDPQHNKAVDTWCFLDQDTKLLVNLQQLFSPVFLPPGSVEIFFPFSFQCNGTMGYSLWV